MVCKHGVEELVAQGRIIDTEGIIYEEDDLPMAVIDLGERELQSCDECGCLHGYVQIRQEKSFLKLSTNNY